MMATRISFAPDAETHGVGQPRRHPDRRRRLPIWDQASAARAESRARHSSERTHALLELPQPVGHAHLAVHRRHGRRVLVGLLGFTSTGRVGRAAGWLWPMSAPRPRRRKIPGILPSVHGHGRQTVSATADDSSGRIVGALVIVNFAGLLHHLGFSPLLPLIAADLNVGVPLLGQVPAMTVLLAGTLGLVIGPLSDLYGHARAIRLGALSVAVSAMGMALSPGYLALLFFGLVGALGRATVQPIALALVGAQLTPESA